MYGMIVCRVVNIKCPMFYDSMVAGSDVHVSTEGIR